MKVTLNVLENRGRDADRHWPGHMFGGRVRTSTLVLIIAFFAVWWTYDHYRPHPPPPAAPQVVPPGFVPDPSYTWVPRSQVQSPPSYDTPTPTPPPPTTTPPTDNQTPDDDDAASAAVPAACAATAVRSGYDSGSAATGAAARVPDSGASAGTGAAFSGAARMRRCPSAARRVGWTGRTRGYTGDP